MTKLPFEIVNSLYYMIFKILLLKREKIHIIIYTILIKNLHNKLYRLNEIKYRYYKYI